MTDTKCFGCGGDLKRIYSKKKDKHYWVCESQTCGKFFGDDNGTPVPTPTRSEPDPNIHCPSCGAPMRLIAGKNGKFYSCSAYPTCKTSFDIAPDGGRSPVCPIDSGHGPMRLMRGKNGQFWGCRQYPDCGETLQVQAGANDDDDLPKEA